MNLFSSRLDDALMLFEADGMRDKYESIVNMYRSGVRVREIAVAHGESIETIENILSKLDRRDEARSIRRNDIIRMFSDGYSAKDIAGRYGISVDDVYNISRSSEGDSLEDDFGSILPGVRGAPRKFDRDQIVSLYNSGVSVVDIASKVGASVPTVYNILKSARDSGDVSLPKRSGGAQRRFDRAEVVNLYNSGMSAVDIASKVGASVPTVYNILRRFRDSGGAFECKLDWALGRMISENTWPDDRRRAMRQDEHERWNAKNYPGTRQLCVLCGCETDRCEEDEMTVDHIDGPLCIDCYRLERVDDE